MHFKALSNVFWPFRGLGLPKDFLILQRINILIYIFPLIYHEIQIDIVCESCTLGKLAYQLDPLRLTIFFPSHLLGLGSWIFRIFIRRFYYLR